MEKNDIVIVAAKRTPMGAMLGQLSSLSAPQLGALAHQAVLNEAQIDPAMIDEIISGCVLSAGIGQAPARQAAILANIPDSVGATTINKMCGSGMKAVMLGADLIKADAAQIVLAGGMESMSNAPYLLKKGRTGMRLGHSEILDHMFLDGLEDAYDKGKLMGIFAEDTAKTFHFSREQQDEYALRSMTRALATQEKGIWAQEIVPVTTLINKQECIISQDESPDAKKLAKITQLRPAFSADGTITAANSSSISDGAASLLLMTAGQAQAQGIKPIARIVAYATHAQAPQWFTTAPIDAIRKVLSKAQWQSHEVDLFEINEAFAVVALVAIQQLELDNERVNIHGGACALGHPIGASGARILVTLINGLRYHHKKRGIAALCIGGGEATAMAIELL